MGGGRRLCVRRRAVLLLLQLGAAAVVIYLLMGGSPPRWTRHTRVKSSVQLLSEACRDLGADLFLLDPVLLSDLAINPHALHEHWAWDDHVAARHMLTFGLIDPEISQLSDLVSTLTREAGLAYHVTYGLDLRRASTRFFLSGKSTPRLPYHYLFWSRDDPAPTPWLHLVVFRGRGVKLWHGALTLGNWEGRLPSKAQYVGRHALMIDRFPRVQTSVGGVGLSLPANQPAFLHALLRGTFVECDVGTARAIHRSHGSAVVEAGRFGETVMELLRLTATTMEGLRVPFWLSSGTLLGWYRQCDVLPYCNDVDLEMKATDYSEAVTTALQKAGLKLLRIKGKVNDSLVQTFRYKDVNMDLFSVYRETDYVWTGSMNPDLSKFRLHYEPYDVSWADLRGLAVRVPDPPGRYLAAVYGPDWRTPVVRFNITTDRLNRRPHGRWDPALRDTIIRDF